MKYAHAEKISKGRVNHSRGELRFLKRKAARAMRRMGRMLLDDAPKRRAYRGWSD